VLADIDSVCVLERLQKQRLIIAYKLVNVALTT